MNNKEDILIGKTAVAFGYINPVQLATCIQQLQKIRQQNTNCSLSQIFLREGLLSQAQLQAIEKQSFGRYRIEKEIGRGGMGRVYRAYDPQLDRVVALKTLLSQEQGNAVDRFLREAKTTAKLEHPNIIKVFDIGTESGMNFFAMEFINGVTLKKAIQNKMSTRSLIELMIKICRAVDYAHQNGVVHRDIKSVNIMLDANNIPYVMDFGLAKVTQVSKELSRSGTIVGTLEYMAPEQASGNTREVDAKSDIYSLGVVLYEICTGQTPFRGKSFANLIRQINEDEPRSVTEIKPRLSKHLDAICKKAMAKDKKRRYKSAQLLAQDLEKFLSGEKIKIKKMSPFHTLALQIKKRKFTFALTSAMLIVFSFTIYLQNDQLQKWKNTAIRYKNQAHQYEEKYKNFTRSRMNKKQIVKTLRAYPQLPKFEQDLRTSEILRMASPQDLTAIMQEFPKFKMLLINLLGQMSPDNDNPLLIDELQKVDAVTNPKLAETIILALSRWLHPKAYPLINNLRNRFPTMHPLRWRTKNAFNYLAKNTGKPQDRDAITNMRLTNITDSALLATAMPKNKVRIELSVTFRGDGTILDTVGVASAAEGAWNLRVSEEKIILSVYFAQSGPRDVRGWTNIGLYARKNREHHVVIDVKNSVYQLTVDGEKSKEYQRGPLAQLPVYLGDYPRDNSNTYGAIIGNVQVLYIGQ
ncbi:serine/threonine protein kinase [Candidatus Uabimicrobium amorphum]|uniref:non-specific serine/threonine protein kinase n=1 Tax=Uabimicrobium amorphum TaxID=2596890 RepID=A0A5S9IP66_UABAM|nr:serine/threonine-protein kinase [Candidatus Uabimicrobium amorphum]BBM85543.1 protein kinase [Candidatus Uabimicrobium amorphum]